MLSMININFEFKSIATDKKMNQSNIDSKKNQPGLKSSTNCFQAANNSNISISNNRQNFESRLPSKLTDAAGLFLGEPG